MSRIEVFCSATYTEIETEDNVLEAAWTLFNGLVVVLSQIPTHKDRIRVLKEGTRLVRKKLNERRNQS